MPRAEEADQPKENASEASNETGMADAPDSAFFLPELEQPRSVFRSGTDALLLADFVPGLSPLFFVELGTGCGMAACALARRLSWARGMGVDVDADAARAAASNAARLNLAHRLHMHAADLRDLKALRALCSSPADLVLANPPYRREDACRPSPRKARQTALCGPEDALDAFCAAAFALLRHRGYFCVVFAAARLHDLLHALRRRRFGARRLRCVHSLPGRQAFLVLVEARKECADDLRIEPPLTLLERPAQPPEDVAQKKSCFFMERDLT